MKFCNTLIRFQPASAAMLVAMVVLPALAFAQAPAASAPPVAAGPGAPPAVATPTVPPVPNAPAAQAPVTSAPATTPAPAPEITLKLPRDLSP
jgi:hypothetical protein